MHLQHLPWATAQKIRAEQELGERVGAFRDTGGEVLVFELEEYSWRADVTRHNIAAAKALGWDALHRLLLIAQQRGCEALELARDNMVLPAVFDLALHEWP